MILKTLFLLFLSNSVFSFESVEQAGKILMPFKKELMKTLKTSFKKDGVTGAIDKCHVAAPGITDKHSNGSYVIGRTSFKYRNPSNRPEKWMEAVLLGYEKSKSIEAQLVSHSGVNYYVEPIYTKGLCLNCHGSITQPVKTKLSELYPQDRATGYKLGEFRGMFWMKANK